MAKHGKMEDRTARVEIYAIGPAGMNGKTAVKPQVAGIYQRSEAPDWAESAVHYFADENSGETFGVWGSAAIDRALRTIPEGTYVELEYAGTVEVARGTMKDVRVRVPVGTGTRDQKDLPF